VKKQILILNSNSLIMNSIPSSLSSLLAFLFVAAGMLASPGPSHARGLIYGVADNGDLMWYRHEGRNDGTFKWTSNEGRKVGQGWNARQVFSGGDGIIYAVMNNGDLMWYRHEGRNDGTFRWTSNEGRKVGHGWTFKQVFAD
jgi:outer membrane protein assembly factor BamB